VPHLPRRKRSRFLTACANVTRVSIRFATPTMLWKLLFTRSHRYIPDRFLPDKAIDVIDEARSARQAAGSPGTGKPF
jgi:hypothetical protein